jgi:hypothetical protein
MREQMAEPHRLDDRQQQFLRTMLTLEPNQWATEGLAQLGAFRHATEPISEKQAEPPSQRQAQEILELLDSCKKVFWQDLSDSCMTKLQAVDIEKFPELQSAAQRILRWYQVRRELLELVQKMGKDSLAGKLQLMATMSAREIAFLKMSIFQQEPRWFGPNYRKQARRIKRQYPQVYALDPDWFDELCFWPNLRYK